MHGVVDAQPVSRHGHVIAVHLQQSFGSRVVAGPFTGVTKIDTRGEQAGSRGWSLTAKTQGSITCTTAPSRYTRSVTAPRAHAHADAAVVSPPAMRCSTHVSYIPVSRFA